MLPHLCRSRQRIHEKGTTLRAFSNAAIHSRSLAAAWERISAKLCFAEQRGTDHINRCRICAALGPAYDATTNDSGLAV